MAFFFFDTRHWEIMIMGFMLADFLSRRGLIFWVNKKGPRIETLSLIPFFLVTDVVPSEQPITFITLF
jgi:hypothetical protein